MRHASGKTETVLFVITIGLIVALFTFAWATSGGDGPAESGVVPPVTAVPTASEAEGPARPSPEVSGAFVGDRVTVGDASRGDDPSRYPTLLSTERGWAERPLVVGAAGGGYTATPTFADVVARVIAARPSIVILLGSQNDRGGRATVRRAASSVLRRLNRGLPGVPLVVVAPPWRGSSPPAHIDTERSALSAAALDAGDVTYVDPIRDGWFTGKNAELIASDGGMVTAAGQRRIAELLARVLQDRGVEAVARTG